MNILGLTRHRRIRRFLGLLSLSLLAGAALEPVAHVHVDGAPAEMSAAPSGAAKGSTHFPHLHLDCVLCHVAGSVTLPGPAAVIAPAAADLLLSGAPTADPPSSEPATHTQARAPPRLSS